MALLEADLDDILEDALDDFDEYFVPPEAARDSKDSTETRDTHANDSAMEEAYRSVTSENAMRSDSENAKTHQTLSEKDSEADTNIADALEKMVQAANKMDADTNIPHDIMMDEMIKSFEEMENKEDFHDLVDGMMQQLLSKDIMYEPIQQLCEKYPEWLAKNESVLSKEDYKRYGTQYQICQKIVCAYTTEPSDIRKLSDLMQQMQECGNPPSDIVKELAPGMEFNEEGFPVFSNKDGEAIPKFPPELQGDACSVM